MIIIYFFSIYNSTFTCLLLFFQSQEQKCRNIIIRVLKCGKRNIGQILIINSINQSSPIMKKGSDDKAERKIVEDFCAMTGASEEQASLFLKRTSWNIQNAINMFFDEGTLPEKKQVKQTKQINNLFESLSNYNQQSKTKQIDQQKFSEFISNYFKVNEQSLIIPHMIINIMKVSKSGHVNIENFYNLFNYLGCESPKNLNKYVSKLQNQIFGNQTNFKSMYLNTYTFYLVGKQSSMDFELALEIWKLYLKQIFHYYNEFILYASTVAKKPNRVHKDLWRMVYQFGTTVKNVGSVKEDDGWPVFLDDFVEFLKQKGYK